MKAYTKYVQHSIHQVCNGGNFVNQREMSDTAPSHRIQSGRHTTMNVSMAQCAAAGYSSRQ